MAKSELPVTQASATPPPLQLTAPWGRRLFPNNEWVLLAAIAAEVMIFAISGRNFLTAGNGFEITRLAVETGLLALAMTSIIITGGIDLSVGSMMGLAAVLMGVELFGGGSTLYVAGACVSAYLMVGHRSVYPAQHLAYPKAAWFTAPADQPVGHEKVQLSYGLLRWWREVVLPSWRRVRDWVRRR
mgnify:CR=1 FL=1